MTFDDSRSVLASRLLSTKWTVTLIFPNHCYFQLLLFQTSADPSKTKMAARRGSTANSYLDAPNVDTPKGHMSKKTPGGDSVSLYLAKIRKIFARAVHLNCWYFGGTWEAIGIGN